MENVIAENYLCFPALLEMIIGDALKININQYEIAEHFGIIVPYGYKKIINNQKESSSPFDFGIKIDLNQIQKFFSLNNVLLNVEYYDINRIQDVYFSNFLKKHLKQKKYIICTYSYGFLNSKEYANELGHASLITDVNENDNITIYDPGPDNYGYKIVNEWLLYDAIRYKHGGIFIFSKIQ